MTRLTNDIKNAITKNALKKAGIFAEKKITRDRTYSVSK
ncbi:Nmad5 family putative nucleotide modification protein [Morganella morganii]|nr:hypothetical protein [Morganella morganii]ELY4879793.1 hypothetical protein [Morganella morganii]HCT3120330.1 hypothetical protein [Morganella morganii]